MSAQPIEPTATVPPVTPVTPVTPTPAGLRSADRGPLDDTPRLPVPRGKRVLDVVVALGLLVATAPLLLAAALAVRLTSRGPALFRQVRVGHGGEPFVVWKLRTMRDGAEHRTSGLSALNLHADGPLFKVVDDPRVTRVGRLLRRTSVDELPQLVQVLTGHMSLVGPRPALPQEVERYTPAERRRLAVRPGLTGPWQVGGRADLTWDQAVALDLAYVDRAYGQRGGLRTDLAVLLRTVPAVLLGRGAY